jgi:chromate transporter
MRGAVGGRVGCARRTAAYASEMSADAPQPTPGRSALRELAVVFATLGIIGFGGPAAHIALIRREAVERRGWVSDAELVEMIGLTSIIPGPSSTELAMLVGRRRAGASGLVVAGLAFIIPAAAIVLALAWAYVEFGATPPFAALLYGIAPVIVAIVAAALVTFARTALAGPMRSALATVTALLWFAGVNELLLLAGAALVMAAVRRLPSVAGIARGAIALPLVAGSAATSVDLVLLGGVFLKAGALLFGSGYVLLAFLRGDLVERLGWLTDAQLIDAVAIGQVTPGPVFTTATFIGYLLAGAPGALVATVAIFLPGFLLAGLIARFADRVRGNPLAGALLDGVNAAAIGLMAAVTIQLARSALIDPLTIGLAVAGAAALWGRMPSVLVVAAGAAVGVAAGAAGIGP